MSKTTHKINVVENSQLQVEGNLHIGNNITYTINECKIEIPYRLTNNIPSNADHILGRDTELATITNHLAQNKPTVLVNGIGGIGKTSVAAKYVTTFGNQYKHLTWLTVQSSVTEAFTNDLVLLKSLHIEKDVRHLIETQRLTDAFKLVVHKLNTLDKTLVVLDNANNPDDLIEHKNLFDTAKCHYLITSRTQPQEWTIVEIDHLPPDEAVNLFRNIAPSVAATDEDLKNLLSKLFFHTLLIELVAKAVENAGFSFVELQTMIETKFIHDEQLNEDIVSTGKHSINYQDERKRYKIQEYIWLIFSNVKDLGDDSKQILRGMALLPVATPFDRAFLKEHLALFEVKDIVPNLSLLVEQGWLEKEQNKSFKMHPLVADVVKKHLKINSKFAEAYINRVADLIDYNNLNPKHNLFEKNKNMPLADRLNDLFFKENSKEVSYLLNNIGNLEKEFGYYKKSTEYGVRALTIAEFIFDKNHATIAVRQNNLAMQYFHLGKYDKAAALLEKALASDLKNFGKDNERVASRQSNLALVYRNLGKYDKASELLIIALSSDIKNFGKEHPNVAIRQRVLGDVYRLSEKYDEAVILLEAALASDIKNFGEEHPNVAANHYKLGDVYRNLGKYDEALKLLNGAVASDIKNFGQEHPFVAFDKWHLARVYIDTNRKPEAKILLQAAHESLLKNLGAAHPHTVVIQKWVADTE